MGQARLAARTIPTQALALTASAACPIVARYVASQLRVC